MKHAVVILDGSAGWPLDSLGGRTTLQAAHTPNLDALARGGTVGLARTVPVGEEPSSAAACTSILGYDPVATKVGRGAIEAASMGVHLEPGEVALRLNLVTVDSGIMRSYAAGHIATEESRALLSEIAGAYAHDDRLSFHPGVAYRHILVVRDHPELVDAAYTPPHDISDKPVAGHLPRGRATQLLLALMERARDILGDSATNASRVAAGKLPATDVWPFWPGMTPVGVAPFRARYGLAAALTSGVDLLGGLAVLMGIDRLDVPGATDGPDNDYTAQAEAAARALESYDVAIVHVESPDEAGHGGDTDAKIAAIEAIDREIVARLRAVDDLRILAMPDHPTPIALKTHVDDPVPFLMFGPGIEAFGAPSYSEATAAATGRMIDPASRLMGRLLGGVS